AWYVLASRWGRCSLRRCLEPALCLAASGYWVDHHLVEVVDKQRDRLNQGGAGKWNLLGMTEGDCWKQPELAETLQQIGVGTRDSSYSGSIAQNILKALRKCGGLLNIEDFSNPAAVALEPIRIKWNGLEVVVQPPQSQGILLAMSLCNFDAGAPRTRGEV